MKYASGFVALRSSKVFIIFTVCTACLTDGVTYGLVAPVIPFLLKDEGLVKEENIQMSTSLLIAAFSVADFFGAPCCAWYVDRARSRRVPWYLGIVLITAGSMLFGFSNNVAMLVCSRVLHGLSSSILYTVGLAVLVDTVGKDEVGQWMGTAMSCNNIGMIISPMLGGIVYDRSGKLAVFAIMISLGAFDVALRLLMNEPPRTLGSMTVAVDVSEKDAEKCQVTTTITSIVSDNGPGKTNSSASPSKAKTSGRLPGILTLIRSPRLFAALYGVFINECLVASLCAILPLYVHTTFSWSALPAGLLFLCIAVPAFAGPLAGYFSDQFGARWIAVSGFCLTAPLLMLLRLVDRDSLEQKVILCTLLTLLGASLIFFLAPLGAECSFVAEEVSAATRTDLYASSFSLMNCSLAAAGLLGPLAAGGLMDGVGWKWTTVALGVFCATGAVPCMLVTGQRRQELMEDSESA
ncbi:hypothetical protein EKO04_003877 [Ascochyta lentis]|uniref:Major facilitator superfamily (MFS) profile domain-containing protein n=1 Tax=Ascochyta lentis TaxID=205686 RepID=A0A8H7J9S9_9PLEO|nr:hypothetical protein EKO04_003877 [Ascochyta lentis]